MTNLPLVERQWLVHDLALDLVASMGVTQPPVWIESLLKNPSIRLEDELSVMDTLLDLLGGLYVWSQEEQDTLFIPMDRPLVERRFILAQSLFDAMMSNLRASAHGLSRVLLPDLQGFAGYFARVFLAPDPMIEAYRRQGKGLRGFADTFLIPPRVADQRWRDRILDSDERLQRGTTSGFSPS